jgi:hypothetical protein
MKSDNLYLINEHDIGGWISPDGLFFQAHYEEHDDVAQSIVDDFLYVDHCYYAARYLEERGWIRLETNGSIHHDFTATIQQVNVLYYCYTQAIHGWFYKDNIVKYIQPSVAETHHDPMPSVPAQGDQENWQRIRKGVYA